MVVQNWTNQRRSDLWGADAAEWNPARWQGFGDEGSLNFNPDGAEGEADADEKFTTTYSAKNPESLRFHPFTRSPRDCFGKNFAQAEMRVVSVFPFSSALRLEGSPRLPTTTVWDAFPRRMRVAAS